MTDKGAEQERLIHAYVDGDLDDQARAAFQTRCAGDAQLRADLERITSLKQHLLALPSPELPARLGDQIMRDVLAAETRSACWRWVLRPVPVPAWAAALLVIACGAALWTAFGEPEPPQSMPPSTPSVAFETVDIACPAPHAVPVRFLLHAPRAARVSLVGDFNAWSAQDHLMADTNENGVWTVTVPMRPGRYQYKFVVDGEWITDPDASAYTSDGFGSQNAVLSI